MALKKIKQLFSREYLNHWIILGLVLVNIYFWAQLLLGAAEPYLVDPVRDPEIDALLDRIYSGDHVGETWVVHLSEREAEQTVAWYLEKYPKVPFANPHVEITPEYIMAEGDAVIAGLRVHIIGKGKVTILGNGLPKVEILDLNVPLPDSVKEMIEYEIQKQMRRADLLPVRFTSAEWNEGEVIVEGVVR